MQEREGEERGEERREERRERTYRTSPPASVMMFFISISVVFSRNPSMYAFTFLSTFALVVLPACSCEAKFDDGPASCVVDRPTSCVVDRPASCVVDRPASCVVDCSASCAVDRSASRRASANCPSSFSFRRMRYSAVESALRPSER